LETQPRKGAAEQGHGREKDGQGARRSAHSDSIVASFSVGKSRRRRPIDLRRQG
jgi:hypothetical protein